MIRFTPIPPDMTHTVCTYRSDECPRHPVSYVWDDEDHEEDHMTSPSTPGLCLTCWIGHASCDDESHAANVIDRVVNVVVPA